MVTLSLQAALEEAGRLERTGHSVDAAKMYRNVLKKFPRHTPALAGLSRIVAATTPREKCRAPQSLLNRLEKMGRGNDMGKFLQNVAAALMDYPACPILWNLRGYGQNRGGLTDDAETSFKRSIALGPRFPQAYVNYGLLLHHAGRTDEAQEIYRRGLRANSQFALGHSNLAALLTELGQTEAAQQHYETAISLAPRNGPAYRQLADLKTFAQDDPLVAQMRALIDDETLGDPQRLHIHFALSKALSDLGDIEGSVQHLTLGNALRKTELGFDTTQDQEHFARIRQLETDLGARKVKRVMVKLRPIFLVGMPRSGTTLVEQILAAHSKVAAAGELPFLGRFLEAELKNPDVPGPDFLETLRAQYFERITPLANGATMVTDKMPHNFRWIGVIARAFPEAKIVHIHRDPRAVVWSNFKHFFVSQTQSLRYSFGMDDIVAHHALYRDLMGFWHDRYPGRILDFSYDALTEDQEGQSRRLIDFAGLSWEEGCLDFHKVDRQVRTASMHQVKQKMYRGSSQDWEKVAPYLGDSFGTLPASALTYR